MIEKLFKTDGGDNALYTAFLLEAEARGIKVTPDLNALLQKYLSTHTNFAPLTLTQALAQSNIIMAYTAINEYSLVFIDDYQGYWLCYSVLGINAAGALKFSLPNRDEDVVERKLQEYYQTSKDALRWYPADFCQNKRLLRRLQKYTVNYGANTIE